MSSKRSHSKIKETHTTATFIENKTNLGSFNKKGSSIQKVLKKTQSDKYLLKQPTHKKQENALSITNPGQ